MKKSSGFHLGIELASLLIIVQSGLSSMAAPSVRVPNEFNKSDLSQFGSFPDRSNVEPAESIDGYVGGQVLNLLGDEIYVYNPNQRLDRTAEQQQQQSSNQRPPEMMSAPESVERNIGQEWVNINQANKQSMVSDNHAQSEVNKLEAVEEASNGSAEQRPENDRFDSDSFCIGHQDFQRIFHWLCQGAKMVKAPVDLRPEPMSLGLSNTAIDILTAKSFANYRNHLRDFSVENSPRLVSIEPDTFADLVRLRVVYIYQAPKLVSFALSGLHPDLQIIRIQQTGLRRWPDLSNFKQEAILTSIDLDHNKISSFGGKPINMRVELLNLEFNLLTDIDDITFNGSEIGVLLLSENRQLEYIHPNAFSNLKSLMKLDLSRTMVHQLPTNGLQQLRTLIIRDNYALKRIPSIYEFPVLEEAHLTYSYHCCSFRYPQTHDPGAYEEHLRKLQEEINAPCRGGNDAGSGGRTIAHPSGHKPSGIAGEQLLRPNKQQYHRQQQQTTSTQQSSDFEGYFGEEQKLSSSLALSDIGIKVDPVSPTLASNKPSQLTAQLAIDGFKLPPANITKQPAEAARPTAASKPDPVLFAVNKDDPGVDHSTKAPGSRISGLVEPDGRQPSTSKPRVYLTQFIECGQLAANYNAHQNITCTPEPDAFNPCEDIMGYSVLRVAVWFVVGASVFGNLSVIVVLMGVFRRLSVPKFLQLNLAIGDLFMGVYLAMLAFADLTTVGAYFNYAIDWQHGFGCRVAGAASLFASQLSIFTLSVITFERYYTITYSIDLNMRLQLGWATRIMLIGWIYAFSSAMLPIFADINSYSKTSICLPMRTTYLSDRLFIVVLLIIDSSAFVIIFACYLKMYLLILRQKTEATAKERTVAMRMALLVSTDFACWAPIIFFSATALLGRPLISVTNSKILIVFFYPLNSMANPFLYVISTRQYRRDLTYLSSRWHAWRKSLFKRNNGSYYSNNAAYGAALLDPVAGLNAHLGAVAAVTGVASHLHHNHILSTNLMDVEPVGGLKLHEQRVVCSQAHPTGQYIIRHQILTDKHVNSGRSHRALRSPAHKVSRLKATNAPSQVSPKCHSPKRPAEQFPDSHQVLANAGSDGVSKLVEYSLEEAASSNNRCRLLNGQLVECPVLVMDCDAAAESNQADEHYNDSQSNCVNPGPKEPSRCRLSPRAIASRGSTSGRHSAPNFCNRCCGCSRSFSAACNGIAKRTRKASKDDQSDETSVSIIPLPSSSKLASQLARRKLAANTDSQHIDILGNLSNNEQTSSLSDPSSAITSGRLDVASGVCAGNSSTASSCDKCRQACLRARPATSCGTPGNDTKPTYRHYRRHRYHHNHHCHHCCSRESNGSGLQPYRALPENEAEEAGAPARLSLCRSQRRCYHTHCRRTNDSKDKQIVNDRRDSRRQTTDCSTSYSPQSRMSSQSEVAAAEMDNDKTETIQMTEIKLPDEEGPSPTEAEGGQIKLSTAAGAPAETGDPPKKEKELESILKVPSDKLAMNPKRSNNLMSLLFNGGASNARGQASSLRGSRKGKEKKRVSIMASHHSG